jgi:hypothetical protein
MVEQEYFLKGVYQMYALFFLLALTTIANYQALIRLGVAVLYRDDENRNDSFCRK